MKRFLIFLLIAFMSASVVYGGLGTKTQSVQPARVMSTEDVWMDANRMNGTMRNNGVWFYDYEAGDWGLEWPKGSGLSPLFAGGQWITAKVGGQVRVAGVVHSNTEFQPGEIINGAPTNPQDSKYQWYVIQPGGVGDWDAWPTDQGAPVDKENKPLLLGEKTAFCVYNDNAMHTKFGTEKMQAEVRQLVWQFNRADALGDMIFMKWTIINKGNEDWDSTYISIWTDPDLGQATDDLVGSDSTLGLGYVYNSTDADQQYGSAPPALGVDFFQGPIIDETGSTVILPDGTVLNDKKMLKMTAFIFYNNEDSPQGEPRTGGDAWNYVRGFWKDGASITDPDGLKNPFMYSGDPEAGTGWLDDNADDRRFLMTAGPFTMPKWEDTNGNGMADFSEPGVQDIVAGIIVARGSNNLNSVTTLKIVDVLAQMAYDLNFVLAKAPLPPVIEASNPPNTTVLTWNETSEFNEDGTPYESADPIVAQAYGDSVIMDNTEVVIDDSTYNFYGYTAYQYSDASGADPVVIGHWDIGGTFEATPYTKTRYLRLETNKNNKVGNVGDPLLNGKEYYFGVKAHGYLKYGAPKVNDSPATIVTVVPQFVPGARVTSAVDSSLEVIHGTTSGLASDGSAIAIVVDPSKVTGMYYKVTFESNSTWNVLRSADETFASVDTLLTGQTNQEGDDAYNVVDGILVKVLGPALDFKNFQVISNANGVLDPPEMGCFAFNSNGFPFLLGYDYQPVLNDDGTDVDRPNMGRQQATSSAGWGIHTFMNSPTMSASYANCKNRLTNDGARWSRIIPNEWEVRFTAAGGKAFCPLAFTTGDDPGGKLIDVTFELWNVGDLADQNDDVRYFPYIFDIDFNNEFNLLTQAGVDAAGDLGGGGADHSLSGGTNDPFTDAIYWLIPEDTSPGQAGYDALVAKIQTEGEANYAYTDGTRGDAIRRMVFANWNGGDVNTGEYNSTMPETGTTFRILTTKPNLPKDYYTFKAPDVTSILADQKVDLDKINVVPNPYYGYQSGEMNPYERWVQFTFLPEKCTIRIFDLAGNVIRKLEKNDPTSALLKWNLENEYEIPVASGIYIFHVDVPGLGTKVGKMAIFAPNERLDTF